MELHELASLAPKTLCVTDASENLSQVVRAWGEFQILPSASTVGQIEREIHIFQPDIIVVFGCRSIIPKKLLSKVPFFNLHLALLPRSRGPAPHIWSLIEGEGIGVTLHSMDKGIDTGAIIAQQPVKISLKSHTLNSAFELLLANAMLLLSLNMSDMLSGRATTLVQSGLGSSHNLQDQAVIQ